MDWSLGYSASYYMTIVHPGTWMDTSRIEITGGTIQRTDSDLLESADIECVNYLVQDEQWIRVWLDARQEGEYSHTPLFTGLATSPSKTLKGRVTNTSAQCYSVLKPAQDILLPHGWYAPTDTNGGTLIKRLLSVCKAPITVEGDAKYLEYPIIAESGETNLSMAWLIADAMGYQIKIDGYGRVTVGPYSKKSKWHFGLHTDDVLEPTISVEYDWYSCPNVFRASAYGMSAIAKDEDPESPLSIAARGREVWEEENNCDLSADESLVDYAMAKLKELQKAAIKASYDRRYHPEINVYDVITLDYPEQGLIGNYMVTSQNVELGYNAKTSEEVIAI